MAWKSFTVYPITLFLWEVSLSQKPSFKGSLCWIISSYQNIFVSSSCINNIFSLRKSSMQLSRRLFPPPTLAAHPKKRPFLKTRHRSRQDNTVSTLGVSQCYIRSSFEKSPLHMSDWFILWTFCQIQKQQQQQQQWQRNWRWINF